MKKLFTSLNVINRKPAPCKRKGVLRHHTHLSYTKPGPRIVATRITTYSWHACTTQLSLPWDFNIKYAYNQPIYRRVYDCKCPLILGSHNNWIVSNFIDYGTYTVEYEFINRTILDGNVMNIYLVILKGNYGAIDADDTSCHGYYIILYSSSPYTLQEDLIFMVN